MQSPEERADEMLRVMGGSLSEQAQRIVLRRLIEAEDTVVEWRQRAVAAEAENERLRWLVTQLETANETLLAANDRLAIQHMPHDKEH